MSAVLGAVVVVLAGAPALAADQRLAAAGNLADEQRLVAVSPGNGEFLEAVPEQVRLTFAEPLDRFTVRVSVRTPSGGQSVAAAVSGTDLTFTAPRQGPGHYVVEYVVTPGHARGQTGFTVLAAGEAAPQEQRTSPLWAVAGVLVVLGLGFVLVRLVRLWRLS